MSGNFSFNTVKQFDKHINYSIPNYNILIKAIISISTYFLDKDYSVYDLGSSTGRLLSMLKFKGRKIGVEISKNLIKERAGIKIIEFDLNKQIIFQKSCIIFSIFTLCFLKKESRINLINNIYQSLVTGGAFIFTEKVYSESGLFQDIFTFSYYDFKKRNFSENEILEKEKSLRRIQKPNISSENMEIIKNAGFRKISMFYKFYNFEGYICIK